MKDGWSCVKDEYTLEDLRNLPLVELISIPIAKYVQFNSSGEVITSLTHPTRTHNIGPREFIEKYPRCKIFFYLDCGEPYRTSSVTLTDPNTFGPITTITKTIRAVAIPLSDFMYDTEMNKHRDEVEPQEFESNRRVLLIGL